MRKLLLPLLLAAGAAHAQPKEGVSQTADPPAYGRPFAGVPDAPDAAIYQVNMRGFSPEGTFRAVTARLDSIKSLGVNVVYLMPIHPIGKERGVDSPFAVQDYQAVSPEFGTLADLRALVAAAHQRKLAVVLDWVGNHTSYDHAWVRQHPDWYVHTAQGELQNPIPEWKDIVQLDFSKAPVRQALTQAMRYWVLAANVDGYRFDYADGPSFAFFQEALGNLKALPGRKLLFLAEGDKKHYYFQAGFQLCYDFGFVKTMRRDILGRGRSVQLLDSLNAAEYRQAPADARMVRYVSNHDLNAWEGTAEELFGGERGALACFVVAAYMQAVPMVYNGQEIGWPGRVPFMGPRQPVGWRPNPARTTEYRRLLKLRAASPALRRGTLASFSSADVCAFTKTAGAEQVLVLTNLRNAAVTYQLPPALTATAWRGAFDGQALAASGGTVQLQPFQYLVLRRSGT